jgi:hypothetical protein
VPAGDDQSAQKSFCVIALSVEPPHRSGMIRIREPLERLLGREFDHPRRRGDQLALARDHQRFEPFGFRRGLVDPVTGALPTQDVAVEHGYVLVGTADTVTRSLERILKRCPFEWLFLSLYCSLVPHRAVMRTIEEFWTKVLPRLS